MSIIGERHHWNGASGEARLGEGRNYNAIYQITTNNKYDGPAAILAHFASGGINGNLPYLGSPYSYGLGNDFDTNAVCDSIRPTRSGESEFLWQVDLHYGTNEDEEGEDENGKKTGNPLNFRDEIDVGHMNISRPVEKAWRLGGFVGTAAIAYPIGSFGEVVNSAGVPFNPPLEREDYIFVLRITKYSANFPATINTLLMHLNNNLWTINKPQYNFTLTMAKHHAQFAAVSTSFDFKNNTKFWKTTYEIHYDPVNELNPEVLDRGLTRRAKIGDPNGRNGLVGFNPNGGGMTLQEYLDSIPPGTPEGIKITDPFGQPVTEPVLFDGDGQPLPAGANAVYLKYRVYPDGNLTLLGL